MFYRQAVTDIQTWYNKPNRKPLVIRGARQVGKTTAVRLVAKELKIELIEINLERHTDLAPLFNSFKIQELLFAFSLISGKELAQQSNVLLFLDEAQAIPSAYAALRYFYEEIPNLAVVLTGSLLDQVLHNAAFPTPIGRIEHYFMSPLTFEEFLHATSEHEALATLDKLQSNTMHLIPDARHEALLALTRRYMLIGGMPYCVQMAATNQSHSEILQQQIELLQSYKDDFAKYSGSQNALQLNAFFNGIIGQVGLQFSRMKLPIQAAVTVAN